MNSDSHLAGILPFVVFWFGLACGGGTELSEAVTVRDSAGVTIVENPNPADSSQAWTVSGEPLVRVGAQMYGSDDVLYRVVGGARLENGAIAVANAGSFEIRIYSPKGELELTVGGEGGGPGEFRDISSLVVGPADSLYAYDDTQRRIAVLDQMARFVEHRSLAGVVQSRITALKAVLGDGSFLMVPARRLNAGTATETRRWADSTQLIRVAGSQVQPTPFYTWLEMFETPSSYGTVSLGGRSLHAVSESTVRDAGGYSGQIRFRTLDGSITRIARWPVTSEDFEPSELIEAAGRMGASKEDIDNLISGLEQEWYRYPDSIPAYDSHMIDSEGFSWLRRTELPWNARDATTSVWHLISADGTWEGVVRLPARLTPLQIGPDFILGVKKTELGEEEVHLYELHRGSHDGPQT